MKEYLKELLKRKDLLFYLVTSGLKAQYRNTFFGYAWWIFDPLLLGAIYYFFRVIVLGLEGENIGAFLIIGLVTWKWISAVILFSSKAIASKASIIKQVYIPKVIFPFTSTITQMIHFSFGLVVVAIFLAFYRLLPGSEIIFLPYIMVIQFFFLVALSLVLSYYSTFIRDIDNFLGHFIRLWFYTSPVIWEPELLGSRYAWVLNLNPAAYFLMGYRNILMYDSLPDLYGLTVIGIGSISLTVYMIYFYSCHESKIIKAL